MLLQFGERLDSVYSAAGQVGWGYQDSLADSYFTMGRFDDEEE